MSTISPDRETGIVKAWLEERGFGFIAPDLGGKDVFVHITALERGAVVEAGDRVEYRAITEPRGQRAVGVRVV